MRGLRPQCRTRYPGAAPDGADPMPGAIQVADDPPLGDRQVAGSIAMRLCLATSGGSGRAGSATSGATNKRFLLPPKCYFSRLVRSTCWRCAARRARRRGCIAMSQETHLVHEAREECPGWHRLSGACTSTRQPKIGPEQHFRHNLDYRRAVGVGDARRGTTRRGRPGQTGNSRTHVGAVRRSARRFGGQPGLILSDPVAAGLCRAQGVAEPPGGVGIPPGQGRRGARPDGNRLT